MQTASAKKKPFLTLGAAAIENLIGAQFRRRCFFNKIMSKINNVINNICYEDNINLYTLSALCKYYKLNFFYINENITHNMFYDEYTESYYLVNNNKDIKYVKKENYIKMCKNVYNIENIQKPLNSITYYKLNELEDIYNKLNIEKNEKYKKKDLYDNIKNYIDSLLL